MKKRASSLIFTPAVGARAPIRPSLLRVSLLFLFLRLLSALVSCWITCTACTDTHTRWRHVHFSGRQVAAGRQRRARGKQPDLLQRGDLGHHPLALSHLSLQSVKQLPDLRPTLLLQRVMIETLRTDKNRKSSGDHDESQQGWFRPPRLYSVLLHILSLCLLPVSWAGRVRQTLQSRSFHIITVCIIVSFPLNSRKKSLLIS